MGVRERETPASKFISSLLKSRTTERQHPEELKVNTSQQLHFANRELESLPEIPWGVVSEPA